MTAGEPLELLIIMCLAFLIKLHIAVVATPCATHRSCQSRLSLELSVIVLISLFGGSRGVLEIRYYVSTMLSCSCLTWHYIFG